MFIGQCKNIIENEESRGEEVVCFRRKVLNRISSSSSSDNEESYASKNLDHMLEILAVDEEEKLNSIAYSLDHIQWNEFANRQQSFTFTGNSGLLMDLPSDIRASEVLSLFLDENLISLIVTETNRYAEQKLQKETTENARLKRWKPTTCVEIKEFIVLMIWMGLVQTPLVTCWSKEPINNFAFPCSQMTRNRFELLRSNGSLEGTTHVQAVYPNEIPQICGRRQVGLAENVCIELTDKLINEERTLFVDNFYTSYQLALKCLQFKTHVIGTVRYNTKFMPSFVMSYPLKRGDIVSREDDK
ncbi:hypothetical protein M0804_015201, partial [Polistes exclamans]